MESLSITAQMNKRKGSFKIAFIVGLESRSAEESKQSYGEKYYSGEKEPFEMKGICSNHFLLFVWFETLI